MVAADISGKADTSSLASVALSGSYNNLLDKPTIPAAYSLPIASNSVLGGIKIGSGLSIDGAGVVTAASSYSLPVASASVLGGVKQGTGTAIAGDGTISVSGYAPIDAPDFTNGIKSAGKGAIASNFIAGNLAGNAKTSGANGVFIGANAGLVDYASNDNVLIGTDAGKSLVSGVSGLTITNAGTGYSTVPTITISSPAAGGVQATATFLLVSGGAVVAPNITNTGKKYDSTATATVTGGGGTGATVTPIIGAGGRNIAIGTGAFATSISSTEGIAIGYKAQTLNAGGGNTVIGNNSAASTASLSTSVVVGNGSLKSTQTCSASVVIGEGTSTTAFALTNCTVVGSGSASNTDAALASTTIVGTAAGNYAKSNSTLIGYTAGSYCSAQYAIAVGISTISGIFASGAYPVAIGNEALRYQTTGSYNTGVGHQAITTNIVGSNNTAVGYKALSAATTSDNTAVGYLAGTAVSTGASNTFLGSNAGKAINTSSNCVAIGKDALSVATGSADANVCVGNSAGVAIAAAGGNVCVGHFAGAKNTSGASNTFIGLNAGSDVSTGLVDGTNCTIIGAGANASSSSVTNQITLGNTAIQSLRCAATSITSASDARDKTDILPIPVGLDFVKQLQPVIYTWNARDGSRVGIKDCGFLAQDLDVLQDSFNLADNLQLVHKDNPNKLEATFGRLLPIFAQAIKDLAAQNQALLDRIEVLENK